MNASNEQNHHNKGQYLQQTEPNCIKFLSQNLLKSPIFFLLTISYIFIPRVSDSNVVEEELPSDNILASLGSFETSRAEAVAVWIGSRELKKIGSLLILRIRRGIPLSESHRER